MEKHITFCAILNIVFSILGVIAGLLIYAVLLGTGIISGDEEAIASGAAHGERGLALQCGEQRCLEMDPSSAAD